ncbi:hypothetical protein LTR36_009355 [Oleoguttula mirabilis]|uniref:Importin N-terminal domain-containing protein n=1 Tax=Oleoguttula mirabilis TaxID=1507867 RepID=A0AAV9JTQ8_9PEZI|nr:hypothetical protein LTR36_009355 [Oleoguttula mirabilis]
MNVANTSVPVPQSIEDVEQLVKRLYQPGSPRVITQINERLQQLQLSAEGWQVADALLGSSDRNVRFFAALTFTVKLNNDGATLDAETAQSVQTRLISWLVRLVRDGEGALVTRKLCLTLTTYYLRTPTLWQRPLLHVASSMQNGDALPESSVDTARGMDVAIQNLDVNQIVALLWLSSTVAVEIGRMENNTPGHAQLHNQMEVIVQDASSLMGRAFSQSTNDANAKVKGEALKSFQTWVDYAQPMWPRKPEALQFLRQLVPAAAQCLLDPTLQRDALDSFRDILESYTSFFQPQDMQLLAHLISEHLQPVLLQALQDKDPEGLPYGQMVIAYGAANIQQVVEQPDNAEGSGTIIKLHFDMLKAPGYPGDEDELSIQSIEFWNTYIEYVNDLTFSKDSDDPNPSWFGYARSVLNQTVELLWAKMRTPTNVIGKEWTDAESEAFREFRLDATDLMLSIYVFLGKDMLRQLVELALHSLEAKQWRAVEAALFCLNALADNVLEDEPSEPILATLFGSSLFRDVANFSLNIPSQARRTAIDILGSYGQYIERHAEYLPDTVRFLFASLETGQLANTAAKSIVALCSTCRVSLTSELDGFLQQYQRFLGGPTSDPYTKEKVLGAIAAIVQALRPESAKIRPLLALLENVEKDVQMAKDSAAGGDAEMAELMGVTALTCLASIGKGMQVPEDIPIDIYDEDEQQPGKPNFWDGQEGQAVQQRIMGCFSVLQVLGNNGDAIEAACMVLKSGFAEVEPGPFVLPPSITVSFLQQCSIGTPQLESVLSAACTLITQHSRSDSKRIDAEVDAICQQVASFVHQLRGPSADPGVAQGCTDVLCRLMPHYAHILFGDAAALSSQLQPLLDFTLQAIDGQDPFPKRSAQDLWTKLIKPPVAAMPDDVVTRVNRVVTAYGPQIAQTLIRQIGGLGQRSELDGLCEPLKALITNQPAAKGWLEAALFSEAFPHTSAEVGDAEKRRFLQQLIGLRGDGRKTKDVVRAFYAACRGTVVSYGP